jgi:hypothetical protein
LDGKRRAKGWQSGHRIQKSPFACLAQRTACTQFNMLPCGCFSKTSLFRIPNQIGKDKLGTTDAADFVFITNNEED